MMKVIPRVVCTNFDIYLFITFVIILLKQYFTSNLTQLKMKCNNKYIVNPTTIQSRTRLLHFPLLMHIKRGEMLRI